MTASAALSDSRPVPSVWRMLQLDFPGFLAALLTLMVWLLAAVLALYGEIPGLRGRDALGPADLSLFLGYGAALSALCLPLLALRLRYLRRLLRQGALVHGTLEAAERRSNGSLLRFSYRHADTGYRRSVRLPTWADTPEPGSPITVILDPRHPRRALIQDLYD